MTQPEEVKVIFFGKREESTYLLINMIEGKNPEKFNTQFMYTGISAPFTFNHKKFSFIFQDTSKRNQLILDSNLEYDQDKLFNNVKIFCFCFDISKKDDLEHLKSVIIKFFKK